MAPNEELALIKARENYSSQKDVSIEAVRIIKAKPDVVFFSIYGSMGPAAREIKKLGYTGPKLAILMDETRIKDGGGALDDTIFALGGIKDNPGDARA